MSAFIFHLSTLDRLFLHLKSRIYVDTFLELIYLQQKFKILITEKLLRLLFYKFILIKINA